MTQYSKRMVIVHWLTFALLIAAWYFGDSLAEATDESKATLTGYIVHMSVGGAVLLFALFRLYYRRKDGTPVPMGDTPMDKLAKGIHFMLYAELFLLPVTGILIIFNSKAGAALWAADGSLLPKEHGFKDVFSHEVHEQLFNLLIALVVVHTIGAIYHQFIKKDGLMSRMAFPKKD